jgi:site-specific DNA recombinase
MKSPPLRYAIYTRQSVESDARTLSSCDVQFSICQDFMQSRGGPCCEWIGERLDDDGQSGATLKRPAVKRLMALVSSRNIDQVVIYRLDRLTRSLRDSVAIFEAFQVAGVELLIVTSPELASTASDRLVLNLMGVFAEFERDMVRSRLADTRDNLRRHGRRLAGKLPYGYNADPMTKQLVVNRVEADHVRFFFAMAADGILLTEIAAIANQRGWKTKTTVAKRSGRKTGGGPWTPRQLLDLLGNPVHTGVFAAGAETRPGIHEAIISAHDFEAVGKQISKRRTTRAARMAPPIFWPLRGKIICPSCGRMMSHHTLQKGIFVHRHYRCRSYSGGRPPCKGISLPAYEIEKAVAAMVDNHAHQLAPPDASEEFLNRFEHFLNSWKSMDDIDRFRLLLEITQSVEFDQELSNLSVKFDSEAISQIGLKCLQESHSPPADA